MITLITGLPGNGKTLFALHHVHARASKEGRPVYYLGIPELTLPWTQIDSADEWLSLPDGSIVVIDEAQSSGRFPKRGQSAQVPAYVEQLAIHRHRGFDFYLITQHPLLIDHFVRRLAEDHFHLVRAFGTQSATVHKFPQVNDQPDKTRADSVRSQFVYPKEVFSWYKSAEVHTHKSKIPLRVYALVAIPLLIAALGYVVSIWIDSRKSDGPGSDGPGVLADGVSASARPPVARAVPLDVLAGYIPRVPGLPHTAPRYDEVMRPVTAPQPRLCISSTRACRCYTDQATRIDMPDDLCSTLVERGWFDDTQDTSATKPAFPSPSPSPTT